MGVGRHVWFAVGVGLPMLTFYAVVVPFLIVLRLRRARDQGDKKLESPSLTFRFGLFFSGYRSDRYWWELVVLLRKIAIIIVSTFVAHDLNQLQLVLATLIVSLHLHHLQMPFGRGTPKSDQLHYLEVYSVSLLIFFAWSGVYFTVSGNFCAAHGAEWCIILVVLLIFLNVLYVLALVGKFFAAWCKDKKNLRVRLQKLIIRRATKIKSASLSIKRRSNQSGREEKVAGHTRSTSTVDLDALGSTVEMIENPFAIQKATRSGNSSDYGGGGQAKKSDVECLH